ncbi:hypothetical protein [Sphingobacterium sp. UDSM-2020]|uniref:hypothetical protein n=1 Tax=Sphingobacterium sp. UDSM-2020 TaxID=2795738 RepID=UPI0019372E70|nr:hypothetical protein [Sphingobacterium sp. UDSM-2020]QQD12563.1 hypothetical protein JAZ75_18435 [Sphingobacterium sp. UDSM-2020]
MMKFVIGFIFLCLSSVDVSPQKEDIVVSVILKNVIGKSFTFNQSDRKDYLNDVIITYLGKVETKNKSKYHILTWGRIWGPNRHTTGTILLYDYKKRYFGKYVLGAINDLPVKLDCNKLIFDNKQKIDCDQSIMTTIDFETIPKDIFLKCNGDQGDIYELSF